MIGTLLIVSGPSGSGKTTLCRRAEAAGLTRYSISCTTRAPRPGERNDIDYHFLSRDDFDARVAAGDFLEHATVHGNSYGTLKADIVELLLQGHNVVMDIDVQGAASIRGCTDPRHPPRLRRRLHPRPRPRARSTPARPRHRRRRRHPPAPPQRRHGRRPKRRISIPPHLRRSRAGLRPLHRPAHRPRHAHGPSRLSLCCGFESP